MKFELFAAIVILGAFGLVGVGIFRSCSTENTTVLKDEAVRTVKELGFEPIGASCMNQDSNGDGYVSCTVTVVDENKKRSLMAVECGSNWSLKNDCRLTRGVMQNSL